MRAWLGLLFAILAVMVLAPLFLTLGPVVDARLLPPIHVGADDVAVVSGPTATPLFRFTLVGYKDRPCRLENYGIAWRVDHSIVSVGLFQADGTTPQQIPASVQDGENFVLGPFYAPVVSAARSAPHPSLAITFYYRCQGLWLTEVDLMIPLGS